MISRYIRLLDIRKALLAGLGAGVMAAVLVVPMSLM